MNKMLFEPLVSQAVAKAKEDIGINNIWKYLRYYRMYIARFKWYVDDKDYSTIIEKKTFFANKICLAKNIITNNLVVMNIDDEVTDENGMVIKVNCSGENNYKRKNLTPDKDCVILYSDSTGIPPLLYVWAISNNIIEIENIIKEQNNMLRKPVILYGVGEQFDNALNNAQNIFSGLGFINLKSKGTSKGNSIMDATSTEVLNLQMGNSYKGKELWENHNKYEEIIKDYLGYNSVNNEKKERMITDEVNQSNAVCETFYQDALEYRKNVVKRVKDVLGINIKLVEVLNKKEENKDVNKDNEMERFNDENKHQ